MCWTKNVKQHDILLYHAGFTSNDLKSVFDFYIELSFHAVYVMDSDRMDCHVSLYRILLKAFFQVTSIIHNMTYKMFLENSFITQCDIMCSF